MDNPLKYVRTGVTESAMLLFLHNEETLDKDALFIKQKLRHMWNSIGFYNRAFQLPVQSVEDMAWSTHATTEVREYWNLYLKACENADCVVHLKRSIEDADDLFGDGFGAIHKIFDTLIAPPTKVADTFQYNWVNQCVNESNTIIVSPFARLMDQQAKSGNLAKLRPDFKPRKLNFFEFPYCFGNTGPHKNSFETIEWATKKLSLILEPGTTVLFSCGSMGVIIADSLHKLGANVFYCGGAMQLFFGIMGGRWRNPQNVDRALHKEDNLLESYTANPDLWISDIPQDLIPTQAKIIENACYW